MYRTFVLEKFRDYARINNGQPLSDERKRHYVENHFKDFAGKGSHKLQATFLAKLHDGSTWCQALDFVVDVEQKACPPEKVISAFTDIGPDPETRRAASTEAEYGYRTEDNNGQQGGFNPLNG